VTEANMLDYILLLMYFSPRLLTPTRNPSCKEKRLYDCGYSYYNACTSWEYFLQTEWNRAPASLCSNCTGTLFCLILNIGPPSCEEVAGQGRVMSWSCLSG